MLILVIINVLMVDYSIEYDIVQLSITFDLMIFSKKEKKI